MLGAQGGDLVLALNSSSQMKVLIQCLHACTRILLSPEGMSCGGGSRNASLLPAAVPESALACLRTWQEDRPAESWPDLRAASEVEGPGWTTGQVGGGGSGVWPPRDKGIFRESQVAKAWESPLHAHSGPQPGPPAEKVREKHSKVGGR